MGGLSFQRVYEGTHDGLEVFAERRPPFDCILGICCVDGCPGGRDLGGASHGRGTATEQWVIRGEGIAVSWSLYTGEYLPESVAELNRRGLRGPRTPSAGGLGFHTATPLYEGQPTQQGCITLGIDCFYDTSYLEADEGLRLLETEGKAAVWAWLAGHWQSTLRQVMAAHG